MRAVWATRITMRTGRRLAATATLLLIAALLAVLPASAAAAAPEFLWQVPDDGKIGSGAGQLDHPEGIAADPDTGHLYIATFLNARVSEFDAWGQFVKAWGWGVADGASELQTCGSGATPPSVTCLEGIPGSGPGQFGTPGRGPAGGIALDAAGNLYVGDMLNHRVQKFDPEGNFLLMFGGGVNKGPNHPGNVCTATHITEGDTCGAGANAEGDGQFFFGIEGNHIATGPTGTIFVGDWSGRIQEFEPSGVFKSKVVLGGELAGKQVTSLAIDGSGSFYVVSGFDDKHIYKLSPAGALLSTIAVELGPASPLALDAAGNLYAVAEKVGSQRREVVEFDPAGKAVIAPGSGFSVSEGKVSDNEGFAISGLATNTVTAGGATDVYLTASNSDTSSFASAYGPPPDKWAPPVVAPEIISQYAVSVDNNSALLRAQINPIFWADASYYVEYGTGKCSEGGCSAQQPAAPGSSLTTGVTGNSVTTKGVLLQELSPETTYHYRFVAQSSGGGPVHGVGPGEAEGTFTTPSLPSAPNGNCPNAALRSGASALLADCRAYEMVSPLDKNGADIVGLCNILCYRAETNQASVDGNKLTYSSYKAFGDATAGPYTSQYIASRSAEGWSSHGISPPYASGLFGGLDLFYMFEPEFKVFSPDLSRAWLINTSLFPLTPDAVEGFVNVYRQDNSDDSLTALTTSEPQFAKSEAYGLEFQGNSADGAHAIFAAEAALTSDAAPSGKPQLYDYSGGKLHLVSVLPDGTANPVQSLVGAGGQATHGENMLEDAVSDDGSRVFWSSHQTEGGGLGKLYLRLNPDQDQSELKAGKCAKPAKACTYAVSSESAQFWTADPDGSKALFGEGGNLYTYDVGAKAKTLIASKVQGVLGTSDDLSHIYFVSSEVLVPGAPAGENLYLDREGTITYIAPLSSGGLVSPISSQPINHAARVTPDGSQIAFMSTGSLTGYDNTDANNGKAASEVFTYDADSQQISCVSCNPTGARPDGEELELPYVLPNSLGFKTDLWAAAWINTAENSLYTPNVLSEDGNRLFFNSFDSLVPRDTNGAQDVYEWEAPGSGDCTAESGFYSEPNDGCLSLISSGESPELSEFVDASSDGSDVFFKTSASLDPSDPGLIDIYDARAEGGFPAPPIPSAPCVGDACQSVPAPPNDATPASAAFRGAGDPAPTKPRRSCRARKVAKGSKKAKRHNQRKQQKRCQRANRRAGR